MGFRLLRELEPCRPLSPGPLPARLPLGLLLGGTLLGLGVAAEVPAPFAPAAAGALLLLLPPPDAALGLAGDLAMRAAAPPLGAAPPALPPLQQPRKGACPE
jgi:hypothetical protein